MAKCQKCGKRGLFLRLYDGLCISCANNVTRERTEKEETAEKERKNREQAQAVVSQRIKTNTEISQVHSISRKNSEIIPDDDRIRIHPDIEGLIWILNGPKKNYTVPKQVVGNGRLWMQLSTDKEPSAIDTTLPINQPANNIPLPSLGYFPSYEGMSSEQRYYYLRYILTDPYQKADIGYIFILYYGLERHLLYGNFERAFSVILKLRDVHTNHSFQSYSSCSLIYMSIFHNRKDLYERFVESINHQYEEVADLDLSILAKVHFHINVTPEEMMRHAYSLGFTNNRYIKSDYSTFKKCLEDVLMERYQTPTLPLDTIDINQLTTHEIPIFANTSLNKRGIDVPNVTEAHEFIETTAEILQEAHDRVKKIKAEKRKKNNN